MVPLDRLCSNRDDKGCHLVLVGLAREWPTGQRPLFDNSILGGDGRMHQQEIPKCQITLELLCPRAEDVNVMALHSLLVFLMKIAPSLNPIFALGRIAECLQQMRPRVQGRSEATTHRISTIGLARISRMTVLST